MSTPLPSLRHDRAVRTQTGLRRWAQVTLTRAGTSVTLEPTALRVTQDARRSMRWDGSLTVADSALTPTSPRDLLAPFGTRVSVDLGVTLLDGTTSSVAYGRFFVSGTRVGITPDSQQTQLQLLDLANAVERYRFEEPLTVNDGTDLAQVANIIITSRTGVNPNIANTGETLGANRVLGLDPETGPWSELQDILAGRALTAWYDRSGTVVIGSLDVAVTGAAQLEGTTSLSANFDTQPYNVIVVRGEPPDADPVQSVAYDDDPGSPTYAGESPGSSPYGRVTKFFSTPLIYTQQQADDAAAAMLAEAIGAGASWSGTRGYDPTIDPLDVYTISGQVLAVDSVTVDLTGDTSLQFRTLA